MSEKKDRTVLIVSVIVVAGVLVSVVGACLAGGLAGYVLAGRQVKSVEQRIEDLEDTGLLELPEFFGQDRDSQTPGLPDLPEIPDFGEEFMPFQMPPGGGHLSGAWIQEVISDSPAEEAGLQPDDLIIAVDAQSVDADHPLQELIGEHRPGDRVDITFLRGDGQGEVTVRLGAHPDNPQQAYLGVFFVSVSMQQRFERDFDFDRPNG